MSMHFLFRPKKYQRSKKIENILRLSQKVWAYRQDILTNDTKDKLQSAHQNLEKAYKNPDTHPDITHHAYQRLDTILRACGGKLYPVGFLADNIEMFLVAAIVALAIRAFFIQPFKIPTNSMYPTYSGMIIPSITQTIPQTTEKIWKKITLGADYYLVKSPSSGQVSIPMFSEKERIQGAPGWARFQVVPGKHFFGLLPCLLREYTIYIDNTPISIQVPLELSLDDVFIQTFFTQSESLQDAIKQVPSDSQYRLTTRNPILTTPTVLKKGDNLLNFHILTGDMLFVDKFTYHFRKPTIGDPIVFKTIHIPELQKFSTKEDKYYIKRLVGQANDTLYIKNNTLFRNQAPIQGAPAFQYNAEKSGQYGGYQAAGRLQPHRQETIPPQHVFAMGDNSYHSFDSRFWGSVPEREIVGKAIWIFYPFSHRWGIAK